ncbi:MAG: NAD-dependent epimerase/dehydratase family protein [Chitinophagia bacterium]|nr:NAD-dependent epimerase/dehydratase family protein [Chitinophagia bacterium]
MEATNGNVWITGASGFIGSSLLRKIIQEKVPFQKVYATDVRSLASEFQHPKIEFIKCDVRDEGLSSLMKKYDIEQIPVMLNNEMTGSVTQAGLFKKLIEVSDVKDQLIGDVMEHPLPVVELETPLERLTHFINKDNGAILCRDESGQYHILTKYDILDAFSKG